MRNSSAAITTRTAALFAEDDLRALAAESCVAKKVLDAGFKSVCSVPLLSHDRVLGTLNVGSGRADAFSPDDLELLGQVGQQIAIAVENGVAYRQIAEHQGTTLVVMCQQGSSTCFAANPRGNAP